MVFIESSLVFVIGLLLGSFSTALSYRVPRKMSWGAVRSACPSCKTRLGVLQLIPVLSWAFSKGKCSFCKSPISAFYPLSEIVCGLLCLGVYFVYGLNIEGLIVIAAIPFLVSLFLIDIRHMILPNQLVFILLVIGIARLIYYSTQDVFGGIEDMAIPYLLGAAVFSFVSWCIGFVMTRILKKDALGMGDVKFFMVSGIWLGLDALGLFMILSGGIGVAFSVVWRVVTGSQKFPFGPALILSFYILLLFQGSLL